MLRILVTGADGLLAHALRENAPQDVEMLFCPRATFDLTQPDLMARQLGELRPDVVINTAAYNQVDRCETERELSWSVNATGPETLAKLCAKSGIRLVHYGTDYVFDGRKDAPYVETDPPNPLNHYAAGKLAGEQAVLAASPQHLVLRPSWVFGWHPTQTKTYLHTVLRAAREGRELKSTTDQVSVPTFAPDLACWTVELIKLGVGGLWHAVNDEPVSRYDWTRAILAEAVAAGLIPIAPPVEAVTTAYFNSTMRRPAYSALSNAKMTALLGKSPGSWRAGLRKMLAQESGR
jgi:dTDP-4-dehydrorhamnose reductase